MTAVCGAWAVELGWDAAHDRRTRAATVFAGALRSRDGRPCQRVASRDAGEGLDVAPARRATSGMTAIRPTFSADCRRCIRGQGIPGHHTGHAASPTQDDARRSSPRYRSRPARASSDVLSKGRESIGQRYASRRVEVHHPPTVHDMPLKAIEQWRRSPTTSPVTVASTHRGAMAL